MKRLLREPLIHFLLLGGLLLFAQERWAADMAALLMPVHIEVTDADRQRLRDQWFRETGRAPDDAELAALVKAHVDEELLFREARRLGLHKRDPVVRQRLIRNMRFAEQAPAADDQALLDTALALGMVDRDLVVRRRLVQLMRYRLESQAQVTEEDLQAYYHSHRKDFLRPSRLHFEHRFFSPDRRGEHARPDAEQAVAALQAGEYVDADPFLLGQRFAPITRDKVERLFGPAFASALEAVPPGRWSGPMRSGYGLHVVRIQRIEPARPADYANIRATAAAELFRIRERETLQAGLDALRDRYRIETRGDAS